MQGSQVRRKRSAVSPQQNNDLCTLGALARIRRGAKPSVFLSLADY